jgi:hypothetical protein
MKVAEVSAGSILLGIPSGGMTDYLDHFSKYEWLMNALIIFGSFNNSFNSFYLHVCLSFRPFTRPLTYISIYP